MFFNAHVFVGSKICSSKNHLILIGSIIPDIAVTKIIDWDDGLHGKKNSANFASFLNENYPFLAGLGKGIVTHGILDEASHEKYKGGTGYSFQNNQHLVSLIKDYYKIDENTAIKKAHNYIESGVDILLIRKRPDIYGQLKTAIKNTDSKFLAKVFAEYFKGDEGEFRRAMGLYFNLILRNNLENIEGWIHLWEELGKLMLLRHISEIQRKELLNLSTKIVSPTYEEFLNFVINKK